MAAFTWMPARLAEDSRLLANAIFFLLLLLSLTFHEYGHAWSAKKLGDDTAERLGRLSLNPLVHIDLMFTVILPLFFLFTNTGFLFGAAKPVPVNPFNLRKPTRDMMLTSAAGPGMNVVLALFFTAAYWFQVEVRGIDEGRLSSVVILEAIRLNVILAVFNMIPIPPLDGHRVLGYFLPTAIRNAYYRIGPYGLLILFLLLYRGGLNEYLWSSVLRPLGDWWGHLMPEGAPLWGYGI